MFERLGHGYTPAKTGRSADAVLFDAVNRFPAVSNCQRERLLKVTEFVDFTDLLRPPGQISAATKVQQDPDNQDSVLIVAAAKKEQITSYPAIAPGYPLRTNLARESVSGPRQRTCSSLFHLLHANRLPAIRFMPSLWLHHAPPAHQTGTSAARRTIIRTAFLRTSHHGRRGRSLFQPHRRILPESLPIRSSSPLYRLRLLRPRPL